MSKNGLRSSLSRKTKGLVAGLALMLGVAAPRTAHADGEEFPMMSADGTELIEPVVAVKTAPDFARMGAAAAVSAVAFGGMSAVTLKKSKQELALGLEMLETDVKRMENFKQEFLDGVPSDNSLMASLTKAMNKDQAPQKEEEEDEFEKNVRLFLEEEEAKNEGKKGNAKADGSERGGATLLERPSDPESEGADAWINDIEFEDKPASVDDEQLKALQRMFGSGPEGAGAGGK
jgi:hypothetical protein